MVSKKTKTVMTTSRAQLFRDAVNISITLKSTQLSCAGAEYVE